MLASLVNVPRNQNDWELWSWCNRLQIAAIRQAIREKYNVNLAEQILYPLSQDDFASFLQANSQAHTDFNSVLGLQGSDIEELDPKDEKKLEAWIYSVYQELYSASAALGI